MKSVFLIFVLTSVLSVISFAEDVSFDRVKLPQTSGKQTKAVLTFSDSQKALLVRPLKGDAITVPYEEIDKCSYRYSRKHRIRTGFVVLALGADPLGFLVMLTTYKLHWLEVDYHDQNLRKSLILRMDKRNYPQILNAMNAHTGNEPEVLGNVDKRSK